MDVELERAVSYAYRAPRMPKGADKALLGRALARIGRGEQMENVVKGLLPKEIGYLLDCREAYEAARRVVIAEREVAKAVRK